MSTGLVIGKFMPPHKGHELLIDFASQFCDTLFVLVSGQDNDVIPVGLRAQWLQDHYNKTNNDIRVLVDYDDIPMGEVDENGTVTEQWFWDAWIEKLNAVYPQIDVVFSSDLYGERLAKELGAVWVPVDPYREAIPISATDIRDNPFKNFAFLMDEAKDFYRKRVVIVGPESCGKTTLAKYLAEKFNTNWVPEYGRTISTVKHNDLTVDDFVDIGKGHSNLIECLSKNSEKVMFVDTEAFTTYLFGKIYLNSELDFLKEKAKKQKFDLYLLMAPSVKWVDDTLRVQPDDDDRWNFFNELKNFLIDNNKPYVIIDEEDFKLRNDMAYNAVLKLVTHKPTWKEDPHIWVN